MVASITEPQVGTNPFIGPRAFQTGERLYGRARESAELVDLLIAERIVLLYSPSGAGKSSLINAVVIPVMQKEQFMVAPVVRINAEPPADCSSLPGFNRYVYSLIRSLEDVLPEESQYPSSQLAGMQLEQYFSDYRKRASGQLNDYSERGGMFLVIDQLEEILRLNAADQEAKNTFFVQLGDLLRHDRALWMLAAIREDYLAALQPYARPIPNRLSVTYRLDFLDARAAIDAIQGPAKDSGVVFEDAAARQLVDSLRSIRVQQADGSTVEQLGPYVEPVQLQVVCRRLWDKAAEKKVVTVEDVGHAGNIDDALSDYYSEHISKAVAASGVGERQIREWFDRKLITAIGIRGQVLMEPESSGGLSNRTIKLLQEAYLVRADKRGNAVWFELAHDRLTRPIRRNNSEWFAQHLSLFQRQADFWNLQGKPEAMLLSGQAYLDGEKWVKENPEVLTQPGPEKEFLEACRRKHRIVVREQRMNTIIRWTAVGMFALALAAGFFFIKANQAAIEAENQKKDAQAARDEAVAARQDAEGARKLADDNKRVAEVRGLVAQSVSNLSIDPAVSITLALEAAKGVDISLPENADLARMVEDALRRALPATRMEQVLRDSAVDANGILSHQGRVWSTAFDTTGNRVVTAGDEGTIKIWDTISGNLLQSLPVYLPEAGTPGITYVSFSPDGKLLAAATGDGRVFLYDADTYALKQSMQVHQGPIWSLAFSPDRSHLAMAGSGGFAQLIDLREPSDPVVLQDEPVHIHVIAYHPDGTQVVTGNMLGQVMLWDARSGRLLESIQAQTGLVSGLAFSPDGKVLATAGAEDRIINLWSLGEENRKLLSITGHRDGVNSIVFSRDGRNLISASADRTVRFWDTTYGRPGITLYGHTDQVYALALSPNSKRIVTASKDRTARIWNISPQGSREYATFDTGAAINDLAISPDGAHLVEAGEDNVARVMVSGTDRIFLTLGGHTGPVEAVAYNPDGSRIVTGSQDGTAIIWNASDGTALQTLHGHLGTVYDAVINPHGGQVATAGADQTVKIWNGTTGALLLDLKSEWGPARCVAFSPDGTILAAGYAGTQVVLWNARSGERLQILQGHSDVVRALAFKPDGSVLVSAGEDGSILLWDMNSKPLGQPQAPIRDHGDAVLALAFTSDGRHLFSGGADGIGTLWDLEVRRADFQTYGQTDRIYAVAISPGAGNEFLFTGGRDGTLHMHAFHFEKLVEVASGRSTRQFTAEECRQFLNAACPADVAVAVPESEGPTVVRQDQPDDALPRADNVLRDADSSGSVEQQSRARFDDLYDMNRFERPFNADQSIYYPDIDILEASMSRTSKWMYFEITLKGPRGEALMGNYAVELDMNGDGRGDYLITTLAPGSEWSTSGVRIWEDKNGDVGNDQVFASDPPQAGDGYEILVFDQGSGELKDLAWSRISPDSPNTIQIAVQRGAVNRVNNDDRVFVWFAWASRDAYQPAWFNYNDHFSVEEAGLMEMDENGISGLNGLTGLDNTCRVGVGDFKFEGEVYCRQ